jgi:hypothetical protein
MDSRKLLRKAIDNPQSLRFSDAVKLAEAFGFTRNRVAGSHHIFKRPGIPELLNLQNVRGMAKAYQSGNC